jgi:hypothetical protein
MIWLHSPATPSELVTLTRNPYVVSGVRFATDVCAFGVDGRLVKVLPPSVVSCQLKKILLELLPASARAFAFRTTRGDPGCCEAARMGLVSPRVTTQEDVVRRTVNAKLARAVRQAEQAPAGLGLKQMVPVREGLGAALYWSPICASRASDPEAHFQELCESLGLEPATTPATAHG